MDLSFISAKTRCNLPEIDLWEVLIGGRKEVYYRAFGFFLDLNMKAHPQKLMMF